MQKEDVCWKRLSEVVGNLSVKTQNNLLVKRRHRDKQRYMVSDSGQASVICGPIVEREREREREIVCVTGANVCQGAFV